MNELFIKVSIVCRSCLISFSSWKNSVYWLVSASCLQNAYILKHSDKLLSKKLYVQLCVTQIIVYSNSKITLSLKELLIKVELIFFREKFRVGKLFAKCLLTSLLPTRSLVETEMISTFLFDTNCLF